ncbi:iron ABC transporter permease [Paenibacillus sp. FSL A5-0031]|uniref:FecCD family ABC transporter permease n=1 Tax=Paenibacillus sp. FSL A5-0031 TaxID=1920420 RepID=UPI00096F18B8|nr:iron ABC transporter permease [Paenibacillus sp. FSL A5-0031]OME87827.1 iron ABC transporter permease [Paenibacillus sp. FSL A5-0031]
MSKHGQQARFLFVLLSALALSIAVMYINLTNGTFDISVMDIFKTILRVQTDRDYDLVIFDFRLPRIVIGALVGFALGVAGAVLQGITRNHLADPGILGIHSAAGMAIVLFMFFIQGTVRGAGRLSVMSMPFIGWFGGMAAALLLLLFARHRGVLDPQRLILVGIALSSGFGAITLYISLKMDPKDFEMATVWLAGSIYNATWMQIVALLPWIIILIPIIWWRSHTLNLLHLDENTVSGIGLNKNRERMIFLLCCVGLVSASVSVSGSIGFVGLIAPHIARRLVGLRYKYVVPICGVIGMLMVLVGDFIGKTIFSPAELPAGIVISIIGVPYFVYLLYKKRH